MKPLYPLFAQLEGRRVLVVGGGAVAERKVRALLACGADVHVGAPRLTTMLQSWVSSGQLTHLPGVFEPGWLDGVWLVIAATANRAVNARVRQTADARRMLANVVDDPILSSFQVPAVVNRSPLMIAVSSSGTAPVLARRLRERMEALLDPPLGELAALAGEHRRAIRQAFPDPGARRGFYDWLHDGPVLTRLRQGDSAGAQRLLLGRLSVPAPDEIPACCVTWIRVSLEDPGRLTLNELRAMNEADVLVYPANLPASFLDMARKDADRRSLGEDAAAAIDGAAHALALCAGYARAVILQARVPPQDQKSNSASTAMPVCNWRTSSGKATTALTPNNTPCSN
ncbi:NAD(P)-dependent oxidoreductase [Castellaniella sp.]|uniref:precorrin-2 dehydrogenase/sirohydrochlorin ferrochelatase family protein n=1 Tax=Castellaniella sp. TaxID=1955812 RepID=UPI003C744031